MKTFKILLIYSSLILIGCQFEKKQNVYQAMKAITIDAARTLNLEKQIGSITEGKLANLVILNESPFEVDPLSIKDLKVLATIYQGRFNIVKSNNLKVK